MRIKQTKIYKIDLKKLAKRKGLMLTELAKLAGVNYEHLLRCSNDIIPMSEEHWLKIKKVLNNSPKFVPKR